MTVEQDYVLGTHDAELARLGLQHRVWRARALDAWRRAGFTQGQTLIDVGSGPGYAALDLADIVGPSGRIVAAERSQRYLDALQRECDRRSLTQVHALELDLDEGTFPPMPADGAWARWVFAFLRRPRRALEAVAAALRPGAVFVIHEYFDYSTWRLTPRSSELESFVADVMRIWRDEGGEPDIGLDIPRWLEELGFEIRSLTPIVDVIAPSSFAWQWPKVFVEVGGKRLTELGVFTPERAARVEEAVRSAERDPHSLMITPGVLEIIATRRA